MASFSFYCYGHPNLLATHKSTLEITTEKNLTHKGDCIIGVSSTEVLPNLPNELKKKIKQSNSEIHVVLEIDGTVEEIRGYGNPELELSDATAIIIRKSDYICSKTLMINSNKAAWEISREIIKLMRNSKTKMKVTISV
ncbi:MAG: DUF371 domain-containing protein [Candidatus Heimdallarchaeaceae archaeon]|jgi:hypothetical protein